MKALIFAMTLALSAATVSAQAVHHGSVWIEGPDEALRANTTYTMEVWARIDSPAFERYESCFAGFRIGINCENEGSLVSIGNVQWARWDSNTQMDGLVGPIVDFDITYVFGAQLAALFGGWFPDTRNPIALFSFDVTTGDARHGRAGFKPTQDGPYSLVFYPDLNDMESISIPDAPASELHLFGWQEVPNSGVVLPLAIGFALRTRRSLR